MPASDPTTSSVRYRGIKPGYRVGDDGSVWSCVKPGRHSSLRDEWHPLKPTPQSRGHRLVYLGRGDCRFVHRLVLEAFVGTCPEGMECRHLDGDPGNNRLENLAWGSPKENYADSLQHGTAWGHKPEGREHARHLWDHVKHKTGEKHHRAKLSDEQVRIIRAVVDPAERDGRAARLAEIWGVSSALVRMIASGKRRASQPA